MAAGSGGSDEEMILPSPLSDKPSVVSRHEQYTLNEIQIKISGFQRMNRAGTGLLAGGILLDCIGTITLITGISGMVNEIDQMYDDPYDTYYEDDTPGWLWQVYVGSYSLGFGIPMTVAGSVLKAIGSRKLQEYEKRLERISFRLSPNRWTLTIRL